MNKFKICLKKETFYINDSNCVIGVIFFAVDDWCFPSNGWDDFVVVLLAWLAKQTAKLNIDKKGIVEMCFMEGDFKISLALEKESLCTINFIEGDKLADQEEIICKTVTLPFKDLKTEVKNACETLIQIKETKELEFEKDYDILKTSYDFLCAT